MARRRRQESEGVELFPFLSILACVIGVLILMISSLALGLMDTPDLEAIQRAQEYRELEGEIQRHEQREAELRQLIAQANALRAQLEAARRQLEELRQRADPERDMEQLNREKLAEAQRLMDLIKQLEEQLAEIMEQIEKLKEELAQRQTPPEENVVQITPAGGGDLREGGHPIFVECHSNGLVVYRRQGDPLIIRGGRTIRENAQWNELLLSANAGNDRIVFLLRTDGIANYRIALDTAELAFVRASALPVIGQGRIDLSLFEDVMR